MLIGLVGYAGVGKDTVGNILVERHGFTRRAFADKLRELALAMGFKWCGGDQDIDQRHDLLDYVADHGWDAAKRRHPEVRRFLQNIGQGHRRVFGDDFWVDQVIDEGLRLGQRWHGNSVVITDVRYRNEAQRITDLGGVIIEVRRPGHGPINDHASEGYREWLSDFNQGIIENDGTLDDLAKKIDDWLSCTCQSLRLSDRGALCPVHNIGR